MADSKYANFDYELSQKILNLLKGGYPARLKKVLIVDAPLWFKAPFRILRLFVKEKLRDRRILEAMSSAKITYSIKGGPRKSKPWFDKDCYDMKKLAKESLKKYRKTNRLEDRECYASSRKKYLALLDLKRKGFDNEKQEILRNAKDSKTFWKTIALYKSTSIIQGEISIQDWLNFYRELMTTEKNLRICNLHNVISQNDPILDSEITNADIYKEIAGLRSNKACGPDGIPNEVLKTLPDSYILLLKQLYNSVMTTGKYPAIWTNSTIHPIFKNGYKNSPSNYRDLPSVNLPEFGDIHLLLYADDIAIIGESRINLQKKIKILKEYLDENLMTLNESKSKIMVFRNGDSESYIYGKPKVHKQGIPLRPIVAYHSSPLAPIASLGGTLSVDHCGWLLHCLKSRTNCYNDLCDLVSSASMGPLRLNSNDTDEDPSLHEKHNSEEREKEVEVTKDPLIETSSPSPGLVTTAGDVLPSGPLTLEEFITHLRLRGRRGLCEEYQDIRAKDPEPCYDTARGDESISCSCVVYRLKINQPKNRYTDVLCLDSTRVKLQTPVATNGGDEGEEGTDYVNANFVDGYHQEKAFISTQGPLPRTFPAFWQMVWEQRVGVVVMTTRTVERSRCKCGQYWPKESGSKVEYGPFTVETGQVEPQPDHVVSYLSLTHKESGESRPVAHLQFTSWPDYGVPHSALAMLDFRDRVLEHQTVLEEALGPDQPPPPIVIHCSAGIGRTGTFITLDLCIRALEAEGKVDVRTTVEHIRSQRALSIQMPDQYVFCHLALLEYALSRGLLHDVDLEGFSDSSEASDQD
ncbi:hypothetical protein LAZ67_9003544 [Cordylochernes scorpioides]|uniref:Tyrosine-protein phosphatase non-receptor type 9 n=1 Tax=Cordylochernes scorpioides TaxID=51811 RepID=A0ABY6KUM9_9ARAC|nr:hypothetical protein LAZ67_9003544 [Cordylochernes scorpioides]